MVELNCRIKIVPPEMYYSEEEAETNIRSIICKMKEQIRSWGFEIMQCDLSKIRKNEDEDYPEIEETVVQVQLRSHYATHNQDKPKICKEFCKKWKIISSIPCSYIVLYENESFLISKANCHTSVHYKCLSLGVLPHNGMFYEYSSLQNTFSYFVNFYHDVRNLEIRYKEYEMVMSYDNIRNIYVSIESDPYKIFFDLFNPPLIFRVKREIGSGNNEYKLRQRAVNLKPVYELDDIMESLMLGEFLDDRPEIDVEILGRANVLCLSITDCKTAEEIIANIHFRCSEKPVHYSCISIISKIKPLDPVIDFAHFGSTYLMTAIFKRNYILHTQASNVNQNIAVIRRLCQQNGDCLEKALTVVLAAIDSGKIINFWHAILKQFRYYVGNKDEINYSHYLVPGKCCMIRRIMLTPTRQLFWPPEIMYGNRVLRNFDSQYALRVTFRDDNMSRLSFNAQYADADVFELAIKVPMSNGIRVGSRVFEFLAWSNSQIRDHGVWMYAKDLQGNTAQTIRRWMGDFSHIRTVPKYMARMGQCFSQTEDALSVPLDPKHVRTEKDIESGFDIMNGKPYCFSDGVGKISAKLAAQVHKVLGHDMLCSAFQIRYGGCKGMLVIDPTLKDTDIVFRNSMKKFDSPNNTRLEIAKTSAPIPLQLNRPFITILNNLGVRHRTFLKLQDEMLKTLTDMLFDEEKAASFLESKTPSELFRYKDLSRSGIYLTTEPFFRALLLALHRHHIEYIKARANIAIDPSKGRNMLGVLDETGHLNYGEVFIQYTTDISHGETTRKTTILRGEVLVTKNPCLLAGDVRKFYSVDIPQLHHIVDCIVFPQRGPRPHPNEMAGSDLDGDEYAVIWDKDLIFHAANHRPGDFPAVSADEVTRITVKDMINFLVEYIKNDQVGVIANAHLARADKDTIFSKECIAIAKKFSIAVDFAKNGKSEHLERSERPISFPDFMEKNYKEVYNSKNALGKMYRVCKDFESENEDASIYYQNIELDPDLIYPGWEKYKDSAIKSKNKYNILLRSVLRNYGIEHEAEAFSGAFTHLHCRFHERKDRAEIEKVVIGCIKKLSKSMREEFLEEFNNTPNVHESQKSILQKASAWYVVTYIDKNAKFLSFPWTVCSFLANIKIRKTLGNLPPFPPAIVRMDDQIRICDSTNSLPEYSETSVWNEYNLLCDPAIVKQALRVLILWAQEKEIIDVPGRSRPGFLYLDVFIKLFCYVAELVGYIIKKTRHIPVAKVEHFSSAALCLEFFKFCISLRFYNQHEVLNMLLFRVYKYSWLAKRAVVTYHKFALTGIFEDLYAERRIHKDNIQMKPIQIESKLFARVPIDQATLQRAEAALTKHSGADRVGLREIRQTKKVCVSAVGTEEALKILKSILRKKHVVLRELFTTGVLPVDAKGSAF